MLQPGCMPLPLPVSNPFNLINIYIGQKGFNVEAMPDCIFNGPTLMVGDLNARHPTLGTLGRHNENGVLLAQYLQDHPDARVLGDDSATHIRGGRLDYACLFNGDGLIGTCRVTEELVSDHYGLHIGLTFNLRMPLLARTRLTLNTNQQRTFIECIAAWWVDYSIPQNLDNFYQDLVNAVEDVLSPNSPHNYTHRHYLYTKDE